MPYRTPDAPQTGSRKMTWGEFFSAVFLSMVIISLVALAETCRPALPMPQPAVVRTVTIESDECHCVCEVSEP